MDIEDTMTVMDNSWLEEDENYMVNLPCKAAELYLQGIIDTRNEVIERDYISIAEAQANTVMGNTSDTSRGEKNKKII